MGRAGSLLVALVAATAVACGDDGAASSGAEGDGGVAPGPSGACGSVRLTQYAASAGGWCEFDRTLDVLPAEIQGGMTLAIAEPYDGSSYGGDPGEACGECWEIDTIHATRVVMVHDLCPIEGNPLCAGGHFHFDLAGEAAAALGGGELDEASARRVPCPVSGNVFAQIIDRNEWGYVRLQLVNHRVPIRAVDYRAADGATWFPLARSGGAWDVPENGEMFAADGPGGVFRLTSAQGEVVECPNALGYGVGIGAVLDLGAQLDDLEPPDGGPCEFVPPADVYVDGWGGIPEVRWASNPWSGVAIEETEDGCAAGSCLRVDPLPQWGGFHLYYRQAFPASTFSTLSLKARAVSGTGTIDVAPNGDGGECAITSVAIGPEWTEVTVDVAAACAGIDALNMVTAQNTGDPFELLVDDVRWSE